MRLDRTRIAILERSQPEVFDLTFIVLREFLWPILGCVAILAGPLALLNYWMIHWMAADLIEEAPIFRYLWTMGILVYVEAPLAGAIATLYLGKVTFFDSPTAKELLRDFVIFVPRLVWSQLVMRGVAFVIFLIWMVPREDAMSPSEGFLPFICLALYLLRSLRPYINEIVLLERSPIWAKNSTQITIGKRSSRLHGPNSGDLFGRSVAAIPAILALGLAVFGCIWFVVATFSNDWSIGNMMVHVAAPATFWILAIYVTVFRFLSYLDLRIRREGWEVELKMRAEAARLTERIDFGATGRLS